MSYELKNGLITAISVVGILFGLYLLLALASANTNTSRQQSRCEWTNGYGSERTGKYFEYNPWSLGTQGKCNE